MSLTNTPFTPFKLNIGLSGIGYQAENSRLTHSGPKPSFLLNRNQNFVVGKIKIVDFAVYPMRFIIRIKLGVREPQVQHFHF